MKIFNFFKSIHIHKWAELEVTPGLRKREVVKRRFCLKCKTHQIKKCYYNSWMTTANIGEMYDHITNSKDLGPPPPPPGTIFTEGWGETRTSKAMNMIYEIQSEAWKKKFDKLKNKKVVKEIHHSPEAWML